MIVQKFSITGQHIERTNSLNLVSGSRNLIQFSFMFSSEWDGVGKTAVITTGGLSYNCIVNVDGGIALKNMPTLAPGLCSVSVFGGDLFTTDSCTMTIYESGMKDGTVPAAPPPDIYNQITSLADGANTNSAAAVLAATKAKTDAESALLVANDTQNAAAKSATAAQAAATSAQADAALTTGIVTQASESAASALAAQKAAELAAGSMLRAFGPVKITLPAAGWTGTGPWTQKTPVAGVLAIWNYRLGLYAQEIADPVAEKINGKEIKSITKCVTEDGGITTICRDKRPETDLLVVLVGEV